MKTYTIPHDFPIRQKNGWVTGYKGKEAIEGEEIVINIKTIIKTALDITTTKVSVLVGEFQLFPIDKEKLDELHGNAIYYATKGEKG